LKFVSSLAQYNRFICVESSPFPFSQHLGLGYFVDSQTRSEINLSKFIDAYVQFDSSMIAPGSWDHLVGHSEVHFLTNSPLFRYFVSQTPLKESFRRRYQPNNKDIFICETIADYLHWKIMDKKNLLVLTLGRIDPEVSVYPKFALYDHRLLRSGVIYLGEDIDIKHKLFVSGDLGWDILWSGEYYHQYTCCPISVGHMPGVSVVACSDHTVLEHVSLRRENENKAIVNFGPHSWTIEHGEAEELVCVAWCIMLHWDTAPNKNILRKASMLSQFCQVSEGNFWVVDGDYDELQEFRDAHETTLEDDYYCKVTYRYDDTSKIFDKFKVKRVGYGDDALDITYETSQPSDVESMDIGSFVWNGQVVDSDITHMEIVADPASHPEGEQHGW